MKFLVAEGFADNISFELYDKPEDIEGVHNTAAQNEAANQWATTAALGTTFPIANGLVVAVADSVELKDLFQ